MKSLKNKSDIPNIVAFIHFIIVFLLLMTDVFIGRTFIITALISMLMIIGLWGLELLIPLKQSYLCLFNEVLFTALYYTNEFVMAARGRPVHFIDIYCIGDALNVSDRYSFPISISIVIRMAASIVITVGSVMIINRTYDKSENYFKRIIIGLICLMASVGTVGLYIGSDIYKTNRLVWDETAYFESNGMLLAIFTEYLNSKPDIPDGYSTVEADAILEKYECDNLADIENAPDNVIVIMNEALTDYSLIGDLALSDDPLPFIHSLNDNCKKGSLAVNVYGGSTCNTEFEFLTGNALCFLPVNSVPYVQFSLNGCQSIASELKNMGYSTTAIHPFFAEEWKRKQVYQELGFDNFISGEKFSSDALGEEDNRGDIFKDINNGIIHSFGDDLEYIRGFISDKQCYTILLETIKSENENGNRSFCFVVTVQNHGGYGYEFDNDISFTHDNNKEVEQYLNLIRISDAAFNILIDELKEYSRKTVVIMFGDHQPDIDISDYLNSPIDTSDKIEENSRKYYVPYIMWANYNIAWSDYEDMSVNYLSAVTKKDCGLPLSSFDRFRLDVYEKYPIITWNFSYDEKGKILNIENAERDYLLNSYKYVQYRRMFDK